MAGGVAMAAVAADGCTFAVADDEEADDGVVVVPAVDFALELPLNLNTGFGMVTVCVFGIVAIDCRLRIVAPIDLFLPDVRSNADFVIFFGWISAARSL